MDQSALVYVLVLTRTRVTVDVKKSFKCGDIVACVWSHFKCLLQSCTQCVYTSCDGGVSHLMDSFKGQKDKNKY